MTTDEIARNVRTLVRTVMGMPDNSVRPANQAAPVGGQVAQFATVQLVSSSEVGWANAGQVDNNDGTSVASVDQLESVVASVNFFRGADVAADPAGLAKAGSSAVTMARRLGQRLQLPSSAALMNDLGLGLLSVGEVRDLSSLVDANWESRGQVDLTFDISNQETEAVTTITSADVGLSFQPPGLPPRPPQDIEVTTT